MKNSQKGFIVPALLVVIALLVIGGGVYIYENTKSEKQSNLNTGTPLAQEQGVSQTQVTNSQEQNTGALNVAPTKNLSSYQSTKGNYKIQYPAGAKIDTSDNSCVSIETSFGTILLNSGSNNPCGPTGTGANDVRAGDTITINGKSYKSSGLKSPDNSSGFISFSFSKNLSVGYFPNSSYKPISDSQFQQNMSAMREIFATIQPITPVPDYESGQMPTKVPTISSIGTQSINPGDTVIVYGTNFNLYTRVSFDGSIDPYVTSGPTTYPKILSGNSLSFVAPSVGVGSHTIQIVDSSSFVSPSNKVTLNLSNTNNTPFISSGLVSGPQTANGVPVTLKGVNFSSHSELIITGAGYNTGIANPSSISSDGTELTVIVPLPAYPDVTTANVQIENTDTYKSSNTISVKLR